MKKLLLSLLVIVTFGMYAWSLHRKNGDTAPMAAIPSLSASPESTIDATGTNAPTDTPIVAPTVTPSPVPASTIASGYKNGTYTSPVTDAFYGNLQIKTVVKNRKVTDVQFLAYPSDRSTSIEINTRAMPLLKAEAIQAQNAKVDIVSGATQTSLAFQQALQASLNQAK